MDFQINKIIKNGFSKSKKYYEKEVEEIFFDDKDIQDKVAKIAKLFK